MKLLIQAPDGLQTEFVLEGLGPWRIGRKAPSEICVSDKFVSAVHAELSRHDKGLLLQQLKRFNPVIVRGEEVESAILPIGTQFKIGKTRFRFVDGDVAEMESRTSLIDSKPILAERRTFAVAPIEGLDSAQLMREISRISENREEDQIRRSVVQLVCARLGAQRGFLARCVPDGPLEVLASQGLDANVEVQSLISTTVLGKVVNDLQIVLIANVGVHASLEGRLSIKNNRICAIACAPILNSDMSISGVLYIDNQNRECQFEPRDAEFLLWAGHFYKLYSEAIALRKRLENQLDDLRRVVVARDVRMIAESQPLLDVLDRAQRAARSDSPVLILGESGSGKECVADFIHRQSTRAKGPFIVRNCAAIPNNLFESEMFGHVRGGFTDAKTDRKGAFIEADRGTLFLDEIGEMNYDLQAKLLRVIEDHKVQRVGGGPDTKVDVRIVCASNRDLRAATKAKKFREDLYFRLTTFVLEVPALRDRRDDIVPLARQFVREISGGTRILTPEAEERLLAYEWPGNIRELRSTIENAVFMTSVREICASDLALQSFRNPEISLPGSPKTLAAAERQHIVTVLRFCGGNITKAATVLDIARSTLVAKLGSYGLH